MVTYTAHERNEGASDVTSRADSIIFIKDGFAWLALFIPILWLLFHRMWLVLLAFLVIVTGLQAVLAVAGLTEMIGGWVTFGVSLLFAFQANDLRRWTLARRGYSLAGLATGRNREECEMKFFESWLAAQDSPDAEPPSAPAPTAQGRIAPERRLVKSNDDVIGLFPEPST